MPNAKIVAPPHPQVVREMVNATIDEQRPSMLAAAEQALQFLSSVGNGTGEMTTAELTSVLRAACRVSYDLVRASLAAEVRQSGDPEAIRVMTSTVLEGGG